jgi:hypothetical protein
MASVWNNPLVTLSGGPLSIGAIANEIGLRAPISVRTLLSQSQTKSFHATITTPGVEALGGFVDLIIRSDGTYDIHVHMHDSGGLSYSFRVVVVLSQIGGAAVLSPDDVTDGTAIIFECTGDVEGTDKEVPFVHEPRRGFDWNNSGRREVIRKHWREFRNGEMRVTKAYEHAGIVGTVEEIANELTTFLLGTALLGLPPLATIALVSSTFGRLTGQRFFGPGGLVGLTVAAGTFFLCGPTMLFPAFVAGAAVGELVLPRHRPLKDDEIQFARKVFGDKIAYDRVLLSDLVGIGGRPFTVPSVDGSIILNIGIGNAYDDPINSTANSCNKVPGAVFIHELTHAWQITNGSLEGYICGAAIETKVGEVTVGQRRIYSYASADGDWSSDFNMEQQAKIVEEWFGGSQCFALNPRASRLPMDANDPYFRYIAGNIRLGLI